MAAVAFSIAVVADSSEQSVVVVVVVVIGMVDRWIEGVYGMDGWMDRSMDGSIDRSMEVARRKLSLSCGCDTNTCEHSIVGKSTHTHTYTIRMKQPPPKGRWKSKVKIGALLVATRNPRRGKKKKKNDPVVPRDVAWWMN
jgi:hypothetical protein